MCPFLLNDRTKLGTALRFKLRYSLLGPKDFFVKLCGQDGVAIRTQTGIVEVEAQGPILLDDGYENCREFY